MEIDQLYTKVEELLKENGATLHDAITIGNHLIVNAQVGIVMEMINDGEAKTNKN